MHINFWFGGATIGIPALVFAIISWIWTYQEAVAGFKSAGKALGGGAAAVWRAARDGGKCCWAGLTGAMSWCWAKAKALCAFMREAAQQLPGVIEPLIERSREEGKSWFGHALSTSTDYCVPDDIELNPDQH